MEAQMSDIVKIILNDENLKKNIDLGKEGEEIIILGNKYTITSNGSNSQENGM